MIKYNFKKSNIIYLILLVLLLILFSVNIYKSFKNYKILILYTSYRQNEEIELSSKFINNTNILKNADLLFYCNNPSMFENIDNLVKLFNNKNKKIVKSKKNAGGGRDGYVMGQMEGIADLYKHYHNYDYVIQIHPDVYITNESEIIKILNKYNNSKVGLIVNKSIPDEKKKHMEFQKKINGFHQIFLYLNQKIYHLIYLTYGKNIEMKIMEKFIYQTFTLFIV